MAHPQMTWRTLKIDSAGHVTALPSTMHAEPGDGIAWFVVNESTVQVKVKIKDFKRKSTGGALDPVSFFQQRATVEAGETGLVVGEVTLVPSGGSGTTLLTKYTIELRSSLFDNDYDPDLEIEKP